MKTKKYNGLFACTLYAAVLGAASFVLGRIVPKRIFRADKFPFKCSEREARVYKALRVKDWQSKVPDMSRIFKRIMPEKRMNAQTLAQLPRMIEETCVAESTHMLLSVLGLYMMKLWRGICGVIASAVYILVGNLPFIIIQRYNRPRLQRLLARQERQKTKG